MPIRCADVRCARGSRRPGAPGERTHNHQCCAPGCDPIGPSGQRRTLWQSAGPCRFAGTGTWRQPRPDRTLDASARHPHHHGITAPRSDRRQPSSPADRAEPGRARHHRRSPKSGLARPALAPEVRVMPSRKLHRQQLNQLARRNPPQSGRAAVAQADRQTVGHRLNNRLSGFWRQHCHRGHDGFG